MKLWEHYIKDVQSGKRIAGELEKLAVERFLNLCKKPEYYFDVTAAEEKLQVVSLMKHTSGSFYGKPFNILPWQAFYWAWIFGLKYRSDNLRVTRETLLCMAKKGGKSEVGGATAVLMTFFDGEQRAQCFSAANSTDQALYSWNAGKVIAKQLAADEPEFAEIVKIYDSKNNHEIKNLLTDSFFVTISSENSTLDGTNAHFALIDEFHEAKDDSIPKNLKSGMVLRSQPLLMYVTTRGFNDKGELAKLERKHVGLLRNQFQDDSVQGMIFAFDQPDVEEFRKYWGKPVNEIDKSFWEKSNPGLGVAPSMRGLETMYTDAINEGQSAQTNVMVKNFNIWERQAKTWLGIQHWNKCCKDIDLEILSGTCFGALDLSTTWDLTAIGLLFVPDENSPDFRYICRYYCPEDGIQFRAKRDKVPYPEWAEMGWITATPGNTIDYDFIRNDIEELQQRYGVINWAYDPMFATETATKLTESGIEVLKMKQTSYQFNEPITRLEGAILSGKLNKGKDPILDWMFGNVALRINATGLKMFDKEKSSEKIDGIVALAMCFAGYLDSIAGEEESIYNNENERPDGLIII